VFPPGAIIVKPVYCVVSFKNPANAVALPVVRFSALVPPTKVFTARFGPTRSKFPKMPFVLKFPILQLAWLSRPLLVTTPVE
jgi:hypothetical protein